MQKFLRLGSTLARSAINVRPVFMAAKVTQFRHFSHGTSVFEIESSEDFNEKVIQSPVPVIVDFHADWCGPCQALGPRLEEKVNGQNGNVLLAKINVDNAGEIAMDYGISVVPTVYAFKNGEKVSEFTGVIGDEQIDDFIENILAD
uniref:Thioredoxin domain-containing protein n=1 Tax=Caenorhabditis tropicalis TaxID=1561998 RepID=A0A1I7T5X1_9PELO